MSNLGSLLPTLALAGVAVALGVALLVATEPRLTHRLRRRTTDISGALATAGISGLVLLYLLLLAMDGAGVAWRRVTLAAAALLALSGVACLAYLRHRRATTATAKARADGKVATDGARGVPASRLPGWGDLVAALAVAAFAAAAWTLRTAIPDFTYHWGVKGRRFQYAGGIDLPWLADPVGPVPHPDYPNLLPSLYAATGHLRGFFDEQSMLLWTTLFLALLVLAARSALARTRRDLPSTEGVQCAPGTPGAWLGDPWVQGGTALVALVAAAFGVGYDLAGGGDPVIALALVAALPALLSAGPTVAGTTVSGGGGERAALDRDDLRLGMAAALAAAAKIEGVPLAGLLVLGRLLVSTRLGSAGAEGGPGAGLADLPRRLPRLVLPAAAVVVPWITAAVRHDLLDRNNAGLPQLGALGERLAVVGPAVLEVMAQPEWYGFPWLLLLLPALLASHRLRPTALVLAAQATFYLYVYLSAPVDTRFYVLSSLPRLLYHLLPALLVLLVAWAAPRPPAPPPPEPATEPAPEPRTPPG